MSRLLAIVPLLAFVHAGCTENAVLEIELQLPPNPGPGTRFALTQMRRADMNPFDEQWAGQDLPAVELGTEALVDEISVVSDEDDLDMHVRVRFCISRTCGDLMDANAPERWFFLEHPFYLGHRTEWREGDMARADDPRIESIPDATDSCTADPMPGNCPIMVGRCQIRGCVEGMIGNFCDMSDRHFCE